MPPRFMPGDRVRIIDLGSRGHMRTPAYVRGHRGVVERHCGAFPDPESLAHGGAGAPWRDLYRVRIRQRSLWPDYEGAAGDTLAIEIYEHWLEPAEACG